MAFTKAVRITNINMQDHGEVYAYRSTIVSEDGAEIAERKSTIVVNPDTDITGYPQAVQDILNFWWDADRIARWQAFKAANGIT